MGINERRLGSHLNLLSQAEHDERRPVDCLNHHSPAFWARPLLIGCRRCPTGNAGTARDCGHSAGARTGAIINAKCRKCATAAKLSNRIAPEQLELWRRDVDALSAKITHAGAIFLGQWTPEAIAINVGGPNQMWLPTARLWHAFFQRGLSVLEFHEADDFWRDDTGCVARHIGPRQERLARIRKPRGNNGLVG